MILTITTDDDQLHTVEVENGATVAKLKQVIEFHTGVAQAQQQLWHSNRQLHDGDSLAAAGVVENDLVLLRRAAAAPPPAPAPGAGGLPGGMDAAALLQNIRNNPALMAQLPEPIRAGIQRNDPAAAQQLLQLLQAQLGGQPQAPVDEFSPEAQASIAEQIRRENIEANMEAAMEHSPEVFGEIVMLYVKLEVNNVPLKAFVDSGAQSCVMSLACAERCNIAHLIDRRFQGIVQGVGTQKMAGRVHSVSVKVGSQLVPMSVTIIEALDIDFLFGLDMLRRYRCAIDLSDNCLRFGSLDGFSLPFLPEHELPRRKPHAEAEQAASAAAASAVPGTSEPPAASASTAPPAPPPQQQQQPVVVPQPAADAGSADEAAKVQQLVALGFPREQCLQALRAANGNVEQAAALLFG